MYTALLCVKIDKKTSTCCIAQRTIFNVLQWLLHYRFIMEKNRKKSMNHFAVDLEIRQYENKLYFKFKKKL